VVWLGGIGFVAVALGLGVLLHALPAGWPELPAQKVPGKTSLDTSAAMASPGLEDAERDYLWEIEHRGNLLGRYGFRSLANALAEADGTALRAMLAADFTGQVLDKPCEVRRSDGVIEVVRQEDAGQRPAALDADRFVARLLEYRQPFAQPPRAQLSLMALAPVTRGELDGLWQGTCLLRMWGEAQPGQPREVALYLRYRVPKPSRESLHADGWLHACAITQSQVAQASRWLMREVAAERGINVAELHDNWKVDVKQSKASRGLGVYLCDFDRDGILDILITDAARFVLYKGLPGGKFQDVTEQMGLPTRPGLPTLSGLIAGFADLDGDGWEDLILGGDVYRNDEGKRFVLQPISPRLPPDATDVAVADFDRDGRVDIYLIRSSESKAGSWLSGKAEGHGNLLWHNKGNWQFEDVTRAAGVDGGQRSVFSALWLDADNDGWPDLYVPNEFGDGILYVNRRDGTFAAHSLTDGPCDFGTMGVTCGDIDNDGNIDIYAANMYSKAGSRVIGNLRPDAYPDDVTARIRRFTVGSQLHHNLGGLKFEQLGTKYQVASVGWAYGPVLVDLDNDGFLDLYATCGFNSRSRSEPDG
jgi:hypothetical protein